MSRNSQADMDPKVKDMKQSVNLRKAFKALDNH